MRSTTVAAEPALKLGSPRTGPRRAHVTQSLTGSRLRCPWSSGGDGSELVLGSLLLLRSQTDEQRLLSHLGLILNVEVDIGPHRRIVLVRGVLHVDEQRSSQRLVGLVLHRLLAGRHAAVTAVDLDGFDSFRVLLDVAQPEVAHRTLVAFYTLDRHVVILGWAVVGATGTLLTVDRLSEVVESA